MRSMLRVTMLFLTIVGITCCTKDLRHPEQPPSVTRIPSSESVHAAQGHVIDWWMQTNFAPFASLGTSDNTPAEIQTLWAPKSDEKFQDWYLRIATKDGILAKTGKSPYKDFIAGGRAEHGNIWDEATGHYKSDYAHPSTVRIFARIKSSPSDMSSGRCRWAVNDIVQVADTSCSDTVILTIHSSGDVVAVLQGTVLLAKEETVPEHKVIVALGDSFDAGEGNPDIPAEWNDHPPLHVGDFNWLTSSSAKYLKTSSAYWVQVCNRSFFSHQTYVALKLATENRHRYVTYLHYACAGAQIFDGLLVPQYDPPGAECGLFKNKSKYPCSLMHSQVTAAVLDLCKVPPLAQTPSVERLSENMLKLTRDKKLLLMDTLRSIQGNHVDFMECPSGHMRVPDLVMLGVGGNDVRFSDLIMFALLPANTHGCDPGHPLSCFVPRSVRDALWSKFARERQGIVCPASFLGQIGCVKSDDDYLKQLERRYDVLGEAIHTLLGGKVPVIADTYPDPIRETDAIITEECSKKGEPSHQFCSDADGFHPENAWDAGEALIPFLHRHDFEFNINCSEARALATTTIPKLNSQVEESARKQGFIVATAERDATIGHTWCNPAATDPSIALESTDRPGIERDPSKWHPYSPMKRYFRTLNDSMRTMAGKEDGQDGTVHPTAQGQAAMADKVYPIAEQIIK